jgi:chemotaxis protein methyltransferase CheR
MLLREFMFLKEEFALLRDFIYEKCGIYFTENKAYLLESRLATRANELGFSSFEDYYYYLKYGADKVRGEMLNLFDAVTTNETSFFRNPPQLDAFDLIVKKNYFENGGPPGPLKIWSAGCSTGEEPYTLAMMMLEVIERTRKKIPFTIYATDISSKALESAKRAVFTEYSLRNTDPALKAKYFVGQKDVYQLKDAVKRCVTFDFMNLGDSDSYKRFRMLDIIFCRNVLIYFDEKMKKKVIDQFYESLKPRGFLTIGHAEFLHNISRGFKPLIFPGTVTYQKG